MLVSPKHRARCNSSQENTSQENHFGAELKLIEEVCEESYTTLGGGGGSLNNHGTECQQEIQNEQEVARRYPR